MISLKNILFFTFILISPIAFCQMGDIHAIVKKESQPISFATLSIDTIGANAVTNSSGRVHLHDIPYGTYKIIASYIGYEVVSQEITLNSDSPNLHLEFFLTEQTMDLDEIVISGTKTYKRQTDSPVIVNVLSSKTLDNVQACNLSEGLRFQPGLRVENDCQTCNYTQLRMNGLAGGYSQILINGRPIFSPLTGLYGMEQLPVNMIERIEVVRGGGSSLYGSSAIGGTVNVITKTPRKNSYEFNYNYQNINKQTSDNQILANATLVSKSSNSGISLFINNRNRGFYDHNGDDFSEIPLIENTSVGVNMFFLPNDNQKLEVSLSNLNEYRFGGEMVTEKPAYLAAQSEERTHNVWMGSADYQINFNKNKSSLITYAALQSTIRDHYTGIIPDEDEALLEHLENPPYGTSDVTTVNSGVQLNHKINKFLTGENVFTLGTEFIYDEVNDVIPAYNYLIDQTTRNYGTFLQSDWNIVKNITLLSGVRMDIHNLVNQPIFSPRASLLYKLKKNTQLRVNYGAGFRAPQAFDADLHIAFAGGGVSRVSLSPDLIPEKSQSLSGSVNYDRPTDKFIVGFTLEGFYTRLNRAFYLDPTGEDEFGETFIKQNGQGATVTGGILELRANYNRKAQLEAGITVQTSEFDDKVSYIDGLDGITEFVRTPNEYGFATLSITPSERINTNLNYIYTGSMLVPHFAGAPNQTVDEIISSDSFSEVSFKFVYSIGLKKMNSKIELYTGVKNILNSYQDQFDIGKNRDSNFVYGPSQPRTIFFGIKLKSK
tara:strand:- start:1410 stop:3728 length:2319 start_codon:yes stop_codon:yes gene_type:complete